ncbi:MAG TPA: family 2 encapsulin nanocompartment cargo protein polyprenyl transferase [Pseudonocardiaceae bacterium]|nr:family 2 encapsulin nanocompartment cargo protein polyprenyl transferase [Pseudonocardiaceae bacterium]
MAAQRTRAMAAGRPVAEVLAWGRDMVTPALRAAVDTLPGSMRTICGYHFGWWDAAGRPTAEDGGKALRPTLALLAACAVGGSPAAAVPGAVAVELVHNFSLLHDDVIDRDVTRRHRPTAWSVFGVNPAILAGDALLTLAFDVLAASGHPAAREGVRAVSAVVQELLDGQSSDMAFEQRTDVTLAECVRMIAGKTGALLGGACTIGASFGGGTVEQVAGARRFGERLGLAFQLVDDLLGIWGDPMVTGKSVHSDLRSRKKSVPVVSALNSGTTAAAELATLYHQEERLSDDELARVAELVEMAGGRSWTQLRADELLAEALRHLATICPQAGAAGELTGLARLATHRDH